MTINENTCRSDALAAVHKAASDLHNAGMMDDRTLQHFDTLCLAPRADGHRQPIPAKRDGNS